MYLVRRQIGTCIYHDVVYSCNLDFTRTAPSMSSMQTKVQTKYTITPMILFAAMQMDLCHHFHSIKVSCRMVTNGVHVSHCRFLCTNIAS